MNKPQLKIYQEPTLDEMIAYAQQRRRREKWFQVFLNIGILIIGILFGFALAVHMLNKTPLLP